jgi:hypothetical protein
MADCQSAAGKQPAPQGGLDIVAAREETNML